ncbi:MAG: hypothetical protein ACPGOY_03180 [Rhodospirillaceae bacterium]
MTFEEMFFYGIGGIILIVAVTVGLGWFITSKALSSLPSEPETKPDAK